MKNPALESYGIMNRWGKPRNEDFLDLDADSGGTLSFRRNGFNGFLF